MFIVRFQALLNVQDLRFKFILVTCFISYNRRTHFPNFRPLGLCQGFNWTKYVHTANFKTHSKISSQYVVFAQKILDKGQVAENLENTFICYILIKMCFPYGGFQNLIFFSHAVKVGIKTPVVELIKHMRFLQDL